MKAQIALPELVHAKFEVHLISFSMYNSHGRILPFKK